MHNWVLFFIHVQISHFEVITDVAGSVTTACVVFLCLFSLILCLSHFFLIFTFSFGCFYSLFFPYYINCTFLFFFTVLVAFPELKLHTYNIILN